MINLTIDELVEFKNKVKKLATSDKAIQRNPSSGNPVLFSDPSLDRIKSILSGGDPVQMRDLSIYYTRFSGIYQKILLYYATLLCYNTLVIPKYDVTKTQNNDLYIRKFTEACEFVDKLDLETTLPKISYCILRDGVYYGFLRQGENDDYSIQDLPIDYCRTRFKDLHSNNILEFNVEYFSKIFDKKLKEEQLNAFPPVITKYYNKFMKGKATEKWVEVYPDDGAIALYYQDFTPLFISSIQKIKELDEGVDREAKRDTNELTKLLIHKLPISKDNNLIFTPQEAAVLQESIEDMLSDNDSIDVLTVFGDTKLESTVDSTSATQSQDRLSKYKDLVYNDSGVSSILFNADGASTLNYSITKDTSLMYSFSKMYSQIIREFINLRFANSLISFDFDILPITLFNQEKTAASYLNFAQYGYSKFMAGVARGIKQTNLINLVNFENNILNMNDNMLPLRSSYTSSGKEIDSQEKNIQPSTSSGDSNKGGRPTLSVDDRQAKTSANIDSI